MMLKVLLSRGQCRVHPTNHVQVPGSKELHSSRPHYSIPADMSDLTTAVTVPSIRSRPDDKQSAVLTTHRRKTKRVQLLLKARTSSDRTEHQHRNKESLKFKGGEHASSHISRVHVWCRKLFAVLGTFFLFGNVP